MKPPLQLPGHDIESTKARQDKKSDTRSCGHQPAPLLKQTNSDHRPAQVTEIWQGEMMKSIIFRRANRLGIFTFFFLCAYVANSFADNSGAKQARSEEEASFQSYLNIYCMNFTQLGGVNNFKTTLLDPMEASAGSREKFNRYWLSAGCEPQLMGGTMSPLAHLAAENPTERQAYLEALQKYYRERGDETIFTKIINVKNSRGYTLLDYLIYLHVQREFMAEEEKGVNDFYKFLCDNGAVFSIYKRSCPPEHLKIN